MRLLTIIVAIAAALWSGYWVVGSRALDSAARQFLADQPGASFASLSVAGFPSRFDLTVQGVHLESPDGRTVWDAPFAQVFALTYKPWHVISALPNTQTLTIDGQVVTVLSSYLQASVVVTPDRTAGLNRVTVVGRDLMLQSDQGWTVGVASANLATKRDPVKPLTHEIGLRITDLSPDPVVLAGQSVLPPAVELIYADLVVTLTAPLDRRAGETEPRLAGLTVREMTVTWGSLKLAGQGSVIAGAEGLAEGRIDWKLENWRELPSALTALGLIKPENESNVLRVLEVIAAQSPEGAVVALPLTFKDGWMDLGPLPLGPAPRLN